MKNYWLDKKMERDIARAPVYQDEPWEFKLVDDDEDDTATVVQGIISGVTFTSHPTCPPPLPGTTITAPIQTGGTVTIAADIPLDLGGGTITVDHGCAGGDCQCFTVMMEYNGQFFTVADGMAGTVVMPPTMVPSNFNQSCWFAANGPNRGHVPNITDVFDRPTQDELDLMNNHKEKCNG